MAEDNVNNAMIFEILKNIQATQAAMAKDIDMIKMRMTALDSHFATLLTSLAGQNDRIDRLEERMKRVERRLELRDDS